MALPRRRLTPTIAVRQELAEKNHLTSLADLSRYLQQGGEFKLAASAEFIERPDALPAFEKAYDFKLNQNQLLSLAGGDTAVTIKAAAQQTSGVNAAMAYGTDGGGGHGITDAERPAGRAADLRPNAGGARDGAESLPADRRLAEAGLRQPR